MNPTTKGEDEYCKFTLLENGKPIDRRFQEVVLQDADGYVHRFTGPRLPKYIIGSTGESHVGRHVLQILLRPGRPQPEPVGGERDRGFVWPVRRDVLHVAVGFAGLQLLRAVFLGVDAFASELVFAFTDAVMK